jgi:hypothetical protein
VNNHRAGPSDSTSRLRWWVCLATLLVCLPYLLLKVAWVSGAGIGVSGGQAFNDATRVANVVTAGLEVAAIAVALAFVTPVGRRLPAFVIAFPVWIASGLLTPVMLGVVLGAPVQLLTGGGNPFTGDDVLAPWVFGLVYGGFTAQALLLFTGFVLYARVRWPMAAGGGRGDGDVAGATRGLQNLLGGVFMLTAVGYAAVQLSTAALGGGRFEEPQTSQRVLLVGAAALAVAGAGTFVRLARGGRLTHSRLTMAWLGSGVVFSDALSQTLATVAIEPGSWGAAAVGPGQATLMLLVLLGALCGGIGGALRLIEEEQPSSPAPATSLGAVVPMLGRDR